MTQAVSWAARQGIGQFIDLGAGLPASPAVHQAARKVMPSARVAYVDIDPVVLSHARALLATSDGVTAVAADLRDHGAVLADPELRAVIDLARPVCVILGAVLHFIDADAARAVTAGYARLMAPGSCLVISVACYDDAGLGKQLADGVHRGGLVQPHALRRGVVLRRAGTGGPGRHRGADLAGLDAPAGDAAPRRPCAGRRGTASSLTSSAPAWRADSRSARRRSRGACGEQDDDPPSCSPDGRRVLIQRGAAISGIRDGQPSRRDRGASRSAACTCR